MAYVNYDAKFQLDPVRAAQKFALGLPAGPAGYQDAIRNSRYTSVIGEPNGNLVQGPRYGRRISGLYSCDWGLTHAAHGVERVGLCKITHQHVPGLAISRKFSTAGETQAEGAVLLDFMTAPNGFDAFFLPWTGWGGVVYMTLPANGPGYFFTAGLSGCSIMVLGDSKSPTVYHCGVDAWGPNTPYTNAPYAQPGDPPVPNPQTTHEMWVDLVAYVADDRSASFERRSTIDKREYVNDFQVPNQPSTKGSRDLEYEMQQKYGSAITAPYGSVFGCRDNAGDWSFFLQGNVSMTYNALPNQRRGCRPVRVTKFYQLQQRFARIWKV
jgi:hypothetical protein